MEQHEQPRTGIMTAGTVNCGHHTNESFRTTLELVRYRVVAKNPFTVTAFFQAIAFNLKRLVVFKANLVEA